MALAHEAGYTVKEEVFTLDDTLAAREIFLTGTTIFVLPVVKIGETQIANSVPGEKTCDLRHRYITFLNKLNAESWAID